MGKHIRFDWAMKRMFRQKANFVVLEGFLSELLKEDIYIQEILESESNKISADGKFNKVDILVLNDKDELMLIEIQNEREADYFHRMNFGQAKLISEHISEGEAYENIKKVHSINIVYFDLGQGDDYVYVGRTNFVGMHQKDVLQLSVAQKKAYPIQEVSDIYTTYYILKVNKFNDLAEDSLDEWMYFLKNSEIKESFHAKGLAEAKQQLRIDDLTPEEKVSYEKFLDSKRIERNVIQTAVDEIKEELEIEKHRADEEKHRADEAEATLSLSVKAFNKSGMPIEQIAELLHISKEKVELLLK